MKKISKFAATLLVALSVIASAPALLADAPPIEGVASWYGPGFHGRQTANGERYDMNGMTAAHKTLTFGTRVRVTNKSNGRSVTVRINDRGPYVGSRIIDLSRGAANAIGMINAGTAQVELQIVG